MFSQENHKRCFDLDGDTEDVADLRQAVFVEISRGLPATVLPVNLRIYKNRAVFDDESRPLPLAVGDTKIETLGRSSNDPLIVVVPALKGDGGALQADSSHQWLEAFRSSRILPSALPSIGSLTAFVDEELPVKIGIPTELLETWSASPMAVSPRDLEKTTGATRHDGGLVYILWDEMVRYVLEFVFQNGLSNRDTNHHSSTGAKRPDYVFTLNSICVFRGEEKEPSANIKVRRSELCDKLVWSYGDVPYLFGYAAAGYDLELYAIYREQGGSGGVGIQQVGQSFYLGESSGRFRLLHALLKISLLLQSLADHCPESARDEFRDIVRSNGVVVRLNAVSVEKDYSSAPDVFEKEDRHLKRVYKVLKDKKVPNVDHLVSVDIPKKTIKLKPRGLEKKPSTVRELFTALHFVLEALVVLHTPEDSGAGCWMHRDIRWSNVPQRRPSTSCDGDVPLWFLIDFSDAAPSPQTVPWERHVSTTEHAPELFAGTGAHTTAVDLWSVGLLISTSGGAVYAEWHQEHERVRFVEELVQSDPSKRPTATLALQELVRLEQQYMAQQVQDQGTQLQEATAATAQSKKHHGMERRKVANKKKKKL